MPASLPFHCYYFSVPKKYSQDSRSVRLWEEDGIGKEHLPVMTDDRREKTPMSYSHEGLNFLPFEFSFLKPFFTTASTFRPLQYPPFLCSASWYSLKSHLYKEEAANLEHTHRTSLNSVLSTPLYQTTSVLGSACSALMIPVLGERLSPPNQ